MPETAQPQDKRSPGPEENPPTPNTSVAGKQTEYGGPGGKEPTRYGDWEKKGRCIDF